MSANRLSRTVDDWAESNTSITITASSIINTQRLQVQTATAGERERYL